MFKKTSEEAVDYEKNEPELSADPYVSVRKASVIGPTLIFKGELSANEDLVIEGRIEGTISHQDKNLTVGKKGRVNANIRAKKVEIHGEVEGDIQSDELVKISSTAVVTGNVSCPRIVMEDGAQFFGGINTGQAKKKSTPGVSFHKGKEAVVQTDALSA